MGYVKEVSDDRLYVGLPFGLLGYTVFYADHVVLL